jgi:hypothetical protein
VRPLVHPALARVWRDTATVQIGLDPARALVLSGLNVAETNLLRGLDGRHDYATLRARAIEAGGDASVADRLLDLLHEAGVVIDGDDLPAGDPRTDPLAPDRASVGLLTGAPDGGAQAMAARCEQWVEVRGAGRIGTSVARLLDAAGVGRITVVDAATTTSHDVCPGGLDRRHVGHPRGSESQRLVRQRTEPATEPASPALIVIAPPPGTVASPAAALLSAGVPHLLAKVVEVTGMVGPLVLPGRSACLRCLDLHRTDRDPAWPRIVAQASQLRPAVAACDVTLAAQVAALTAQQALAHLDGFTAATVDGTIEIVLPYGLPRRRSWQPHPACGCQWS